MSQIKNKTADSIFHFFFYGLQTGPVFKNRLVHGFIQKSADLAIFTQLPSLCGLTSEPDRLRSRITVEPVWPAGLVQFW